MWELQNESTIQEEYKNHYKGPESRWKNHLCKTVVEVYLSQKRISLWPVDHLQKLRKSKHQRTIIKPYLQNYRDACRRVREKGQRFNTDS